MSARAHVLTAEELEALLERAAEKGAARALAAVGDRDAAPAKPAEPERAPVTVGPWVDWPSPEALAVSSAIYLLIDGDAVSYVGQSGDLAARLYSHRMYPPVRFTRVRVLPLPDDRRLRTLVEQHIRGLLGCAGGESVRDRAEMRRRGPAVDPAAIVGTGPAEAAALFLRWVLS